MITIVLTSLIFIFIWAVSNFPITPYSTYKIYTQDSVSGLVVDAPVEYKGVEVGKVKSIDLKNNKFVEVLLSIKKEMPITKGTEATFTTKGLTTRGFMGFVYIALHDNGTDVQPLVAQSDQSYPVIPTTSATTLSLDTTFVDVKNNLQQLTGLLKEVLDKDTIESLKSLLHNMNKVSNTLVENNKHLNSLLINMEKASHQFEPFLKSGQNTLTMLDKEFKPFLKSAQHMMTSVEDKVEPFLTSSQKLVKMLEAQFLPQTSRTLSTLDTVSQSLLNLTHEIRQDPSILIRGTTPPPPGPGETNENE
jgi:phospholipid/cholesterol/gamma-HCH transport system substrate-binding protein